jgi:hypothetical protein
MKLWTRRAAAVVLAAILSVPVMAGGAPRDREGREGDRVAKIVKVIKKIFGVGSNDDLPIPPINKP